MSKFHIYFGLLPLIIFALAIFIGIPGSLAAETTDIVIENEGWELAASLYSPGDGESRAVVLLFHKAAGNRGEYDSLAGKLARAGMTALAVDLRGHGASTNLDVFDHVVRKNIGLLEGSYRDIEAARRFMAGDPRFKGQPVAIVGASYSGEHAALAGHEFGYADAYIQLSPGSFSEPSIAAIDASGVPWLFVRAEIELDFFPALFEDIARGSENAEIIVLEGAGHATRLFNTRPELEDRLVRWLEQALFD